MRHLNCALPFAAALLSSGVASAQCVTPKLNSTMAEFGEAGAAVAVDGGLLVVGEPGAFSAGPDSGRVSSYMRGANGVWSPSGHFWPANLASSDRFGSALALSGPVALVGSPVWGESDLGCVHFFEKTGAAEWTLRTAVTAADAEPFDRFGYSVAIDGDHAIVGSPRHDFNDGQSETANCGAAYFYKRNADGTWSPNGKVFETDPAFRFTNDQFGWSVAMSGEYAVVGVPFGRRNAPSGSGWARVFRLVNGVWTEMATLTAPGGGAAGDTFGMSVAIDGEFVVVGAPNVDFFNADSGRVYIFRLSNGAWAFDASTTSPAPFDAARFGNKVAVAKGRAAIGTFAGEVYMMHRTPVGLWTQTVLVQDPDATGSFARSLSTDGYDLAIGDPTDAEFAFDGGAAYIAPFGHGSNIPGQAARLRVGDTFRACTTWATNNGSASCGSSGTTKDVWYGFTVEHTRWVALSTQGSAFDTVLSVHSGAPGNTGNQIVCNDDFQAPERWSRVGFLAQPGMFYFVRVSGFSGAAGEFVLSARGTISCPGDADGDGVIGFADLNLLLSQFNSAGEGLAGDFDLDGDVDFADLNILLSAYNRPC